MGVWSPAHCTRFQDWGDTGAAVFSGTYFQKSAEFCQNPVYESPVLLFKEIKNVGVFFPSFSVILSIYGQP